MTNKKEKVKPMEWIESMLEQNDSPCQFCSIGRVEFIMEDPETLQEIRVCRKCKDRIKNFTSREEED